jgi:drug/metabolite transporter (DMT)-like permease
MRALGVSMALPRGTLLRALAIGLLIAFQSFCLYSSVALLPVALALLAFNTFPMLIALFTWASGGERPRTAALIAMPIALAGLALALDVFGKAVNPAESHGRSVRLSRSRLRCCLPRAG